jgi:hypothetical protein
MKLLRFEVHWYWKPWTWRIGRAKMRSKPAVSSVCVDIGPLQIIRWGKP